MLEAQEGEEPGAQREVRGKGQDHQQDREVDIEAVLDDADHVHVAHDFCVGGGGVEGRDDVGVHVDDGEKVETHRPRQSGEQESAEEQGVGVRVARKKIIIVEDSHFEHRVEGAQPHVADGEEADYLDPPVVVVVGPGLYEQGE